MVCVDLGGITIECSSIARLKYAFESVLKNRIGVSPRFCKTVTTHFKCLHAYLVFYTDIHPIFGISRVVAKILN